MEGINISTRMVVDILPSIIRTATTSRVSSSLILVSSSKGVIMACLLRIGVVVFALVYLHQIVIHSESNQC